MDEMATIGVRLWWTALCVVSVLNLGVWVFSVSTYVKRRAIAPNVYAKRWPHVLLSAGYVLGCSFRSVLPRADVQRICLVDSWWSSVMVGRSVATVAELCFVAQWALLLRELSDSHGDRWGNAFSRVIVPLIVVAETCSWYAVLTTSYVGNAIEQSIWTLTVALMSFSLFSVWRRAIGPEKRMIGACLVVMGAFVVFMCTVDVPMYLTRWYADELRGRSYLSLVQGLKDVSQHWVVTRRWEDWHEEIPWMSLYFSVAVWVSIGLLHFPHAEARKQPAFAAVTRESRLSTGT